MEPKLKKQIILPIIAIIGICTIALLVFSNNPTKQDTQSIQEFFII